MKNIQISPSILSADFSQLGSEIKRLEEGGADMIHVDVMDGHFVPNLTIGPPVIKALRKHCSLKFDVHLMISPVHKYIDAYADAGADIITIHPEATDNLENSIKKIKEKISSDILIAVDGCQSIAHINIDVQDLDCDFYSFSSHKLYGPSGIGIMFGKEKLLESLEPPSLGGGMINNVSVVPSK